MKRYKISEFSEYSGVNVDTLRFYEKMGLLHPYHHPENNYRFYSDYDLLNLMQIRLMRSMDIPIAALQKQETRNLHELHNSISAQVDALESEIAVLSQRLDRFKRIQKELAECKTQISECSIIQLPHLYALYYDEESIQNPHFTQQVTAWCKHIPYVHLTCRLSSSEFTKPTGDTLNAVLGIGILADYAASCGIVPIPPAVSMMPEKTFRILLCISDPLHPTREELMPVWDHLARLHIRSKGDWYYRLRFIERTPDGNTQCYIGLRFSIENI